MEGVHVVTMTSLTARRLRHPISIQPEAAQEDGAKYQDIFREEKW